MLMKIKQFINGINHNYASPSTQNMAEIENKLDPTSHQSGDLGPNHAFIDFILAKS